MSVDGRQPRPDTARIFLVADFHNRLPATRAREPESLPLRDSRRANIFRAICSDVRFARLGVSPVTLKIKYRNVPPYFPMY